MKNLFHYRSLIKVAVIIVVLTFMASQITEVYAANAAKAFVGKTGQTIKVLDGDDGDVQAGVARRDQRFKDNINGTITDKLTNLTWDKDAKRVGFLGDRIWSQALVVCNQLADNGGDLTDGSQAGDWHLANIFELESLRHMGFDNPAVPDTLGTGQWSQGDPFNNVQSDFYWSSTTDASNASLAWGVHFTSGLAVAVDKAGHNDVWCVRGGQ